jgi:DNA-binding SARP family transcriptional activator
VASLKIYLFGAPILERDGVDLQVDTRKAVALLAYLVVTGEAQTRDALAALLWPEYDQRRARAGLRRTLSTLHKALGDGFLEFGREIIRVVPEPEPWCDVVEFRRLLAASAAHGHPANEICPTCLTLLGQAVALYRDDFMAGFTLRDSQNFDDWQFFHSDSLRQELSGALEKLVNRQSAQGAYESAISFARRWLALDPLREEAHRLLMQSYAGAGQYNAALRQYQECVRILDQELGVVPLEATTQLYRDIKEHRHKPARQAVLKPPPLQSTPPQAAQVEKPPFVGRRREWASLEGAYAQVGPAGHFVVLEGEAGIGKTRLAEEFLAEACAQGASCLLARCYQGEANLAYGPFVEGLRSFLQQNPAADWQQRLSAQDLSEVARLLPELAQLRPDLPASQSLETPGVRTRFFEGLTQALLAMCSGDQAGILFIDDLQWADEASQDLLTYLARRLEGRPVLLITTWRSEDVPSGHRLRSLLAEVQRHNLATVLALKRLSPDSVHELIRAALPASPEDLSERLYHETEGTPFFIVEYLAAVKEDAGFAAAAEWSIPGGVRDLLHARLEGIGETGWQALQTSAAIGRSFDFDVLHAASGRSEEEVIAALETLIRRGLIHELQPRENNLSPTSGEALIYDFSHDKLRSLVYEETSLARRRLLHRRIAETMAQHARGKPELPAKAGQIAYHYKRAGVADEAAHYYKLAGQHARTIYANQEARLHFQAALALGHSETAWLNEAIGDLYTLQGDYNQALNSYESAASLRTASPVDLAHVEHKLGDVYQRMGEWDLAESHFQSALETLAGLKTIAEPSRIYADWSFTARQRGQPEQALVLAGQALHLAQDAGDDRALAQAYNLLGILNRSQGDLDKAVAYLEESLAYADRLDDPSARIAAWNNLAMAYAERQELGPAFDVAQKALDLCRKLGDRHREAALLNNLADLSYAAGQSERAMGYLTEAVTIFAEIGVEESNRRPEIWKLTEW